MHHETIPERRPDVLHSSSSNILAWLYRQACRDGESPDFLNWNTNKVFRDINLLQVFQVRKKDTGQIYAMKVMRKEKVLEKEHGSYVRAESEILKTVLHPYIVTLRYSFQVGLSYSELNHFYNSKHML